MPEDVVFQILLWLPIVSLLRFKLVCKSWRSLIESSTFISQHFHFLHHHHFHLDNEKEETLVILNPTEYIRRPIFTPSFSFLSGNSFQVYRDVDLPHRFQTPIRSPKIIASCNGIICLDHNFYTDISLWNPATKQFRVLPEPPVPVPPRKDSHIRFSFGFGFDGKTNDYKVVRIILYKPFHSDVRSKSRVDVYSLSMDSWTTTEDAILPVNYIICDPKAPFRNGIYCWFGRFYSVENDSWEDVILSFDFSNEVFETMPSPDINKVFGTMPSRNISYINTPSLALLKENIACIYGMFTSPERENWQCEIWVLNEYGVKKSWTKLHTITLEFDAFVMGVSNNGIAVWIKNKRGDNNGELCLWDPVTQELKNLPYQRYLHLKLQFVFYKESLVSIKSINGATNGVTCEDFSGNCQPSA